MSEEDLVLTIVFFPSLFVFGGWLAWSILDWLKMRHKSQLQNRILEKFTTVQEFNDFIQSKEGNKFLNFLSFNGSTPRQKILSSLGSLAPYLLDNVPCVKDVVRVRRMGASVLKTETAITISGMYAEPSFFRIFSFPLKDGDPETALNHPNSIVISEETADKFFGGEDPMNKTLTLENLGDFMVTGVLRDLDQKSHFRFDALVSFATLLSLEKKGVIKESVNSWSSFNRYYTYVLLRDEDDQSVLEEQLPAIANTLVPEQERETYGFKLQPLSKINLGINLANCMPGTKQSFEYVFIPFLAVLVIFLACFNYIILSIARSLKRTKEIGIRKVLGASVSGMAYLLSKDYIKLILVSAVFALPAGYFLSASVMQFFAFRPGLSLWVLPAALVFVLVLALVTIGSQTVKAALANPIETLREE